MSDAHRLRVFLYLVLSPPTIAGLLIDWLTETPLRQISASIAVTSVVLVASFWYLTGDKES